MSNMTQTVDRCPCYSGSPEDCPEHAAEYERYCYEASCEEGAILPGLLPREQEANRCDACGQFGTADNPITRYPGQPADLENGPSPKDLPYTLHDMGCVGMED